MALYLSAFFGWPLTEQGEKLFPYVESCVFIVCLFNRPSGHCWLWAGSSCLFTSQQELSPCLSTCRRGLEGRGYKSTCPCCPWFSVYSSGYPYVSSWKQPLCLGQGLGTLVQGRAAQRELLGRSSPAPRSSSSVLVCGSCLCIDHGDLS